MIRKPSRLPNDPGQEVVSGLLGRVYVYLRGLKGTWGETKPAMAAAEEEDGGPEGPNRERGGAGATFECNICLETAREAVVSVCGHLYW